MRIIRVVIALTLVASAPAGASLLEVANIVSASCAMTSNKLRYDCTFETDLLTTLNVEWDDGTTVRSAAPSAPGLVHDFRLVGMRAGAVVHWKAWADSRIPSLGSMATGSFTTSALSGAELSSLAIVRSDRGHKVQNILFPADCSGGSGPGNQMLFIADHTGAVVWYQDPSIETGGGQIAALNVTDRGTILAIHGRDIVEYTLEGEVVTHLVHGVDFSNPVHHDVFRRGNRLFALHYMSVADLNGNEQRYDGVTVFDASSIVDQWDLSSLYDPVMDCYETNDCVHTNALWVGHDGSWTLSQRTPGRVIQIDGDPTSATYGQLLWELDGQGVNGDFTIASSSAGIRDWTFEGQHNVQFLSNGNLLLFDNEFVPHPRPGAGTGNAVRALELQFRGSSVVLLREYDTGMFGGSACPTRGSAFKIDWPGGNVLTTCSDSNRIQEIAPSGTLLWEASTSCPSATLTGQPYRTIPVEFP